LGHANGKFLTSKEYWSLIEIGIPTNTTGAEHTEAQQRNVEEMRLKDLKVKNYLFQSIDRTIMETILNRDSAKGIWDSMRQKYQGSTKVKQAQLQALRREFELLGMKDGENIDDYFGRTLTIANKMKSHGERMEQIVIIEKILRSMTAKFDYVVCSIEESNNLAEMTIDELQSSLLVHEQRMKGHKEEEQVLKVMSEAREDDRFGGRGRSREGFRGNFKGRGRSRGRHSFNKAIIECFRCHKLGHFSYECPSWEKTAYYAELNEEDEILLMSYVELHNSNREEVWFLDSGCSNHMSGNKLWFTELNEGFRHSVKLGNNSRMAVMGKGCVKLNVAGAIQKIDGVYYIPELKNNLLSIRQLQEKGLAILIQHNACKLFHPTRGLIMEIAMTVNRMFIMFAATPLNESVAFFQAGEESETQLWHSRFAHLSFKGLRTLYYKKMVEGLSPLKAPTKVYVDCLVGKQHRENISKKSHWRASSKLQLIHSDICGPVNLESNSGKRYLITFIDDFSRKCWVYFISEKSEALNMFKMFKNLVEKKAGSLVGCLRTDRGGEFTSKEFNEYCSMNGIKRQLTAAYTPQQNGVAERKNQTIMNLVRSILSEKCIPREFWPEAVNWCMHVLNRSPTAAVPDITPEEAWSGVKPSVEYFRVFGCIGYVHVPHEKRTKLDPRSTKCILLGISEETKGYRMYNPETRKLIVSRDVIFEENASWNWAEDNINTLLRWRGDDNSISEEEFEGNEDEEREQEQIEETENEVSAGDEVENMKKNIMSLFKLLLSEIKGHHTGWRIMSQEQVCLKRRKHKIWSSTPLLKIHTPMKKPKKIKNGGKPWIMKLLQ
jgi:transposase InsO family protein